jgi:hypothetical protein
VIPLHLLIPVVVIEFQNIPKSWLRFLNTLQWQSPLTRVHQKMLVVDGHVGYCGGLNIGRGMLLVLMHLLFG